MKPVGEGKFNPADPFVEFSFAIGDADAKDAADGKYELRIDNVAYSSPAFYVNPKGKDSNDGRTEKNGICQPTACFGYREAW